MSRSPRRLAPPVVAAPALAQPDPNKVLRAAFPSAETGFDPQAAGDEYSNSVNRVIFDTLYRYDYLARPYKLVPNTAAALPEISADGKTWTIRIRPGIYFADDPAFKGQRRELTAADYVYGMKRVLDPRMRSNSLQALDGRFVGAEAIVAKAKETGKLDYDAPIEGLQAIDRYTLRFKLNFADYELLANLTTVATAAVAREVIEAYADGAGWAMANPVGTGPFRLKEWRRGQKIVLEANPAYRDESYPETSHPDDRALAKLRGRKLPLVGRVEISIIEESNPRLLAFEQGDLDYVAVPPDLVPNVLDPGNKLKPRLAKEGITLSRGIQPAITYSYFNMEDPVVGGYTPDKIALRRAIGMAYNVEEEIRVLRAGQAIPATQPVPPNVSGYNPKFDGHAKFDPAAAKALLDKFGYVDRDKDGWRESARRQAARAQDRDGNGGIGPAVHGAVETQHGRGRAARGVRKPEVRRQPEGRAAGATADVVPRQHQHDDRRLRLPRPSLRRPCRVLQSGAVQAPRVRPALRRGARDARRAGANQDPAADVRARLDLLTVESARLPLRKRARAAVARRLQVQRLQPSSVGVL